MQDDRGRAFIVDQPAERIVSLAPHITELLFAAGAGAKLVGASRFSDFPPAAQRLPVVGDSARIDVERLLSLRPDLVLAWGSGTTPGELARLDALGLKVFTLEPRRLSDIEQAILTLGQLAGTQAAAARAARDYQKRLAQLRAEFAGRRLLRVFLQIAAQPLMTLNESHTVNDVLVLCGGRNLFSHAAVIAPQVGLEDVIAGDPQVIVVTDANATADWLRRKDTTAAKNDAVHFVPPELILRQTPRILEGAARVCDFLERARSATNAQAGR